MFHRIKLFLLVLFFSAFSNISIAELEIEPNNEMQDAMTITSGKVIEGNTDADAADASSDGDPDFYLIDVDNESTPSGVTIRLEGTDCSTCKAVNFALIDKSTLEVVVAENSEQSTTRSEQVIQEEFNITGDTYLKIFSSGTNRDYDLTVWVNDGVRYSAEVEPNNNRTADDYNVLANGKEFKGNIIDTDDDDWIRFTPSLSVASFRVSAEGCDKDGVPESSDCSTSLSSVKWVVLNPDNQQLISGNTADDTTNQTKTFEVPIVSANIGKDHFVKFSSDHSFVELDQTEWSNRSYSVTYYEVANSEEDFEIEPNNTIGDGQTIESGRTYEGNINAQTTDSAVGDLDHYIIDVESEDSFSGITVRLEAEDSSTAKAVHFEVRDKNDDTLIASENAEQTVVNFSQQIIEEKYNIQGDAYIKVFSNQVGQSYKLTIFVDQTSAHNAEYEKNNTISEISDFPLLSSGKRIKGNISANDDVDYFKIDNPTGKATFFVTSEGCDIDGYGEDDDHFDQGNNLNDLCDSIIVSALNSNEQTLNTIISDPGNANQVKSMNYTLPEGVSYIKVSSDHTFSNLQNQKYHNRTYEIVGFLPAAPPVTITSSAGNGGTISPQGNTLVPRGGTITYVATPTDPYILKAFTDTCDASSSQNGNSYTVSGVTKDCAVNVTFSPPVEIVASSTAGGSIDPSGSIEVSDGSSTVFTATADTGFTFENFTGTCGGLPSTESPITITTDGGCTIVANFKRIPGDDVTVTITGTGYPQTFLFPDISMDDSYTVEESSITVDVEQYTDLKISFTHPTDWESKRELFITGCGQIPQSGYITNYTIEEVPGNCELTIENRDKSEFDYSLKLWRGAALSWSHDGKTGEYQCLESTCQRQLAVANGKEITFKATIVEAPYLIESVEICDNETKYDGGANEAEFSESNPSQDCDVIVDTLNPVIDTDGDGVIDIRDPVPFSDDAKDSADVNIDPYISVGGSCEAVSIQYSGGVEQVGYAIEITSGYYGPVPAYSSWDFYSFENLCVDVVFPSVGGLTRDFAGCGTSYDDKSYTASRSSWPGVTLRNNQEFTVRWSIKDDRNDHLWAEGTETLRFTDSNGSGSDGGCSFSELSSTVSKYDPPKDSDFDGVYDTDDAFPNDGTETIDTDGDGIGNNADTDDDGDGVADSSDEYPLISLDGRGDADGDGIPNDCDADCQTAGMAADTDDDNDSVLDGDDAFPLDATESVDTDSDGVGDNADAFPNNASETTDTDGDGIGNNSDNCSLNSNSNQTDTDSDGSGNVCDADDDNDGINDEFDTFPLDATENADSDGDGVGDNGDAFPNNASETTDTDGDGVGDNGDRFPLDASESIDTDGDNIGNNADTDDDGDGTLDVNDPYPLDVPPTLTFNYGNSTSKTISGITLTQTQTDGTQTSLTSDANGQITLPATTAKNFTLSASLAASGSDPISVQDALYILQYIVELRTLDSLQFKAADINGSGDITIQDALKVLQHNVELITLDNQLVFLDANTDKPLSETTYKPTDTPSIKVYRLGDVNLSFSPN